MIEKQGFTQSAAVLAHSFRRNRLIQALKVSQVIVLLVSLQRIYFDHWDELPALLVLLVSIFAIGRKARTSNIDWIATAFLWSVTLILTYFIWFFQGLRDEALIAFPGILIFAMILGTPRLFKALLVFIIINILCIGYVNSAGIYLHTVLPSSLGAAILICILLLLTTYCVWLLSNDFRTALRQLSDENKRVMESQQQIHQLLNHDVLTNLPNRSLAKDRFELAVSRVKRNKQLASLLFIDLDNFKNVNDSLGHQIGDLLLIEISRQLVQLLRESDTVCRLGGDEFLVILEELHSLRQIETLASKILNTIIQPIPIQGNELSVSCSIGIATIPDDGEDFDMLCAKADLAMYAAKFKGKNSYLRYNKEMGVAAQSDIGLIADLRNAINNQELWLAYQPKVDLTTDCVIGAEALLRWNHPKYGLLMPNAFIHLAESSGNIIEIGKWVIRQACQQCQHWHQQGFENLSVAVNVSPLQFKRGDLVAFVLQALEEFELSGKDLELELTESLFLDHSPDLLLSLEQLKQAGVHFSIDDFGTGYSNLGYLKSLPIDGLKIDMGFVQRLRVSNKDKAIVNTVVQMASSLELKSIAEGVDSAELATILKLMGCDLAQGYLWAKPLPADEFMHHLRGK